MVQPETPQRGLAFLVEGQNFADQDVFDPIRTMVPPDFFKDPKDMRGHGALIRTISRMSEQDLNYAFMISNSEFDDLRPYVLRVGSASFYYGRQIKAYIEGVEHLKSYIWEFMLKNRGQYPLLHHTGEMVAESHTEVPTFEAFVRQLSRSERILQTAGLKSEVPEGSELVIHEAIDATGKKPFNKDRRWSHSQK